MYVSGFSKEISPRRYIYVCKWLLLIKMPVNSYFLRILKETPPESVGNKTIYHVLGTVLSCFYFLISLMSHSYPLRVGIR